MTQQDTDDIQHFLTTANVLDYDQFCLLLQDLVRQAVLRERQRCATLCRKSDRYRGDYFASIIEDPERI